MPEPSRTAPDFYSDAAGDFHRSYGTSPNRRDRLNLWKDYIHRYAVPETIAYDIGCGTGILACQLAPVMRCIIAMDGAEGMLEIARSEAQRAGLSNIRFVLSDLPVRDTSGFDPATLVIASSSLEYLSSLTESLIFVRNLLQPGGTLIFSVSNKHSLSRKLVRLVYSITGKPAYFGLLRHFLDENSIRSALRSADLEYTEHVFFEGQDALNRLLAMIFPQRMATNMILAVARRPKD